MEIVNPSEIFMLKKAADIEGLLKLTKNPDVRVRRTAVVALCSFSNTAVLRVLDELRYRDPSPLVRETAARGYERIAVQFGHAV